MLGKGIDEWTVGMEDEKRNSVISKKGGTGVLVNKQRSVD
jgi:hypothetical protein